MEICTSKVCVSAYSERHICAFGILLFYRLGSGKTVPCLPRVSYLKMPNSRQWSMLIAACEAMLPMEEEIR